MRWLGVIAFVAACGSSNEDGPFVRLPLDGDFDVDVEQPVHVARDKYGVAHISAHSIADAAYVQGYVMAHDRLPQMDILRRFGAGTLGELFGALSPDVIDTDLEMRMHRMTFYATESFQQLQQSSDPIDAQVVTLLTRFSDGVNAYATDLADRKWTLDREIEASFAKVDPDPNTNRFRRWTPVDSLVLGRFQAFALSWSTPFETDVTELYQKLDGFYDKAAAGAPPEVLARKGITKDLMIFAPVGTAPTIDGFPNVAADTGSRSDGGASPSSRTDTHRTTAQTTGTRPTVPQELLTAAHALFGRGIHTGPFGALGPHAFMRPYAGSNNWAVAPSLTGDGTAVLATDQHLQLPNPSIFYPTHLTIDGDDALDVIGITFPGIPGVILGTNGRVAWSATVSEHDVNDVYLEDIVPCAAPSGSCTKFMGGTRDLETFSEEIKIGAFGTITGTQTATYEIVPHHGPMIPTVQNHKLVPRTANQAMSVRYTGYTPTFEIRALWKLGHAQDVHEAFRALGDFTYGSQNWTMIDNTGPSIAWTTNALVPDRSPATYAWNATTNPTGAAPFFVLDGKGQFEWEGRMSTRYVPHAIDPLQGYLATANADPVGATFDNDPLNQTTFDGAPLYVGVTYAAGVREERITDLIKAGIAGDPSAAMATIQHDTHSNVGAKLTPPILAALAFLDGTAGAPADVAPFLAGLSAADRALLVEARRLLAAWTFATPIEASDDSAATAVFNTWMHFFLVDVYSDELAALPSGGFDLFRIDDNQLVRMVYALLVHPENFVKLAATGQPAVCDRLQLPPATVSTDSCSKMILRSMIEAMSEVAAKMGTATTSQWAWGNVHRLTLHPLFPNTALDLPKAGEFALPGFAKTGDNFNVNRSDMGWGDTDFAQFADGPAQRFIARAQQNAPITVKWALPGGVIFDSRDPHYRDLLDQYYLRERHFDAPIEVQDIVENGETRWEFH